MGTSTAVFGIYMNRFQVDEAVDTLQMDGFATTDISALFPESASGKSVTHERSSKAPEGAAAGIGAGAAIGGTLGLLAGIGALVVPGIGPFITVGPIMGALAGAAAIGTLGGIAGALVGLGMPEYEAKRYEGGIRNGGILLSVHCGDAERTRRAKIVLQATGAQDIAAAKVAGARF